MPPLVLLSETIASSPDRSPPPSCSAGAVRGSCAASGCSFGGPDAAATERDWPLPPRPGWPGRPGSLAPSRSTASSSACSCAVLPASPRSCTAVRDMTSCATCSKLPAAAASSCGRAAARPLAAEDKKSCTAASCALEAEGPCSADSAAVSSDSWLASPVCCAPCCSAAACCSISERAAAKHSAAAVSRCTCAAASAPAGDPVADSADTAVASVSAIACESSDSGCKGSWGRAASSASVAAIWARPCAAASCRAGVPEAERSSGETTCPGHTCGNQHQLQPVLLGQRKSCTGTVLGTDITCWRICCSKSSM